MTTPLGIALNTIATQLSIAIENTFPDECSILRPDQSVTDYGSVSPTYSTVGSSIGCSWAPATKTGMEYLRAAQINSVVAYDITMPATTDVTPKDRIVVVARGDEPQRTFEVKAILRNSGLPLSVLCTMEEA